MKLLSGNVFWSCEAEEGTMISLLLMKKTERLLVLDILLIGPLSGPLLFLLSVYHFNHFPILPFL